MARWPDGELHPIVELTVEDLFDIQQVAMRMESGSSFWVGKNTKGERVRVHSRSDRGLLVAIAEGPKDKMLYNVKAAGFKADVHAAAAHDGARTEVLLR